MTEKEINPEVTQKSLNVQIRLLRAKIKTDLAKIKNRDTSAGQDEIRKMGIPKLIKEMNTLKEKQSPEEKAEFDERDRQLQILSRELGTKLHQKWRDKKTYITRFKSIIRSGYPDTQKGKVNRQADEDLVAKARAEYGDAYRDNEGVPEIDIQNLDFNQLSTEWQEENAIAGEFAINLVENAILAGEDTNDPKWIEKKATAVHIAWQKRNTWATGNMPEAAKYANMSEELKDKDREHVVLALEVLRQQA